MHVRKLTLCLVLPIAVLAGCSSGSTPGTAVPGIVATTTVLSTVAGPTVSAPPVTTMVTTTAVTSVTVPTTVLKPTTVTATVTKAPTTSRQSSSSSSSAPPQPAGWPGPNADGVGDQAFPSSLSGWSMTTNWQSGPRAFSNGWTPVTGIDGARFPSTMNGCSDQRFLVRWHVANVTIDAAWVDAAGDQHGQVNGSAGWFDLDSCQTPIFRALASSGGIADVSVDVQQYGVAG